MFNRRLMIVIGAAVAFAATGGAAHAQAAKGKPIDFSVRSERSPATVTGVLKSVKWDARKGRWGLTLNLDQPDARDVQWGDLQAGAYFRVTPSLRVGGAVALGDKDTGAAPAYKKVTPDQQPRVRLESAFKF